MFMFDYAAIGLPKEEDCYGIMNPSIERCSQTLKKKIRKKRERDGERER